MKEEADSDARTVCQGKLSGAPDQGLQGESVNEFEPNLTNQQVLLRKLHQLADSYAMCDGWADSRRRS